MLRDNGIKGILASAMAFVISHNERAMHNKALSMISWSSAKGDLKKALNGGKKGKSVKAQARIAHKRRAVKRARRLGHA